MTGRRQASVCIFSEKNDNGNERRRNRNKSEGTAAFDTHQNCRPDSEIRFGILINWKQLESLFDFTPPGLRLWAEMCRWS
jgi:hypothetical protein